MLFNIIVATICTLIWMFALYLDIYDFEINLSVLTFIGMLCHGWLTTYFFLQLVTLSPVAPLLIICSLLELLVMVPKIKECFF